MFVVKKGFSSTAQPRCPALAPSQTQRQLVSLIFSPSPHPPLVLSHLCLAAPWEEAVVLTGTSHRLQRSRFYLKSQRKTKRVKQQIHIS